MIYNIYFQLCLCHFKIIVTAMHMYFNIDPQPEIYRES